MDAARRFREEMERPVPPPSREKGELLVQQMAACNCGCGLPARVTVTTFRAGTLHFRDPAVVDALIDLLVKARTDIWGPRKGGG